MCPLHHSISAELTTHTSVSRQGCSPWHGLCIALSSNSMLSFWAAVFYCRRIFKSHLLSDTQNKSLKGRKTINGNGFSSFHAELCGRFSTFCGAAVFREAKGLVQFLWLILGLNLILQSWTGLRMSLLHLLSGTKGLGTIVMLIILSPVITAWLSRYRRRTFLARWLLFPHESKALASAIIFNTEIYHLLLTCFSIFLTFKNKSTSGLTGSPPR